MVRPRRRQISSTLFASRNSLCFSDSQERPLVSPFLATLTSARQLTENPATSSPLAATLTRRLMHKSCVCHSYKKHRGGVSLQPRYRPGGWLTEWTGRIPDTVNNGRREEEGAPMPWKVSSVMEEKLRFILEYEGGE